MRFHQLLRSLARMPLFTGITVLTLALGIGANTAIFSVIEGVLLKPLPYPRSDELVALDHAAPGVNLPSAGAAPFQYFTYREEGRVFQDVGLWGRGTVSITGRAEPEEVPALFVTDGVLPMLGAQPMLGRLFSKSRRHAGDSRNRRPDGGLLAIEVRLRQRRRRQDADGRQPSAGNHRRAAGLVPLPRSPRVAGGAVPLRSQQGLPRQFQLHGASPG